MQRMLFAGLLKKVKKQANRPAFLQFIYRKARLIKLNLFKFWN
jgi:hypothetical protein